MQPQPSTYFRPPADEPADRSGLGVAALGGGSLALFVMVGRWAPTRVWGPSDWWVMPPRVWALIGMTTAVTLCFLLPFNRGPWSQAERAHIRRCTLFLGYMMAAAIWSKAGVFAQDKALLLGLVLVAVILSMKLVHDTGPWMARSFWMWMAAATTLYGVFTAQSGWIGTRVGAVRRLTPLAGGPNVFARLTALLTITGINYGTRGSFWVLWYIPAAIGIVLTIGTGSRGGLLAGIVGIAALAETRGVFRRRGILPAAILVGVLVVGGIGTQLGERAIVVFQQRVVTQAFEQRDDSGRIALFRQAIDLGMSNPLFGTGLGGFFVKNRLNTYCHNVFLEAFSEGGLVGLALLLFVFVGGMRHLAADRHSDLGAVTWAAFVTLAVASQFSGDTFDSRLLFILPALRPPLAVTRRT